MTINSKAEEWLQRYIQECTLFLPLKHRGEHVKELNSDLLDKLEDLDEENIEEERMLEFLKQEGSPYFRARKYGEQRPLLSEGIMPLFKLVWVVVVSVLTGVSFFAYFFQRDLGIWKSFTQLIGLIFSATGGMIITFALIDRFAPAWKWDPADETWSPKELGPLKNQDMPSLLESIAGWVFGALFIVLFIGFQDRIGFWYRESGSWVFVPLFALGFFKLIPFWVAGVIWEALTQIVLRVQKSWTRISLTMDLLKSGLDLALAFYIFKSGWDYLFLEGSLSGSPMQDLQVLTASGKTLFPAIMIIIMIAIITGIVKKTVSLLRKG